MVYDVGGAVKSCTALRGRKNRRLLCAYVTNVRVPIASFSQTSLLFYAIITHGVGNLKTLMKIRNLDGMGEIGR